MGASGSSCFSGLRRCASGRNYKDVVVIVGPSGVGKSTLIKRLMSEYEGAFGFSVSHTTRQPRPGEVNGVHYNFTEVDKMREAIGKGAFIEHANVHGNIYGTSFAAVEEVTKSGRICLLDIDVQGAQQMKTSSLDPSSAYLFVAPESEAVLESRLRGRGTETEEKITLRLANAKKEIAFSKEHPEFFGLVLVNGEFEKAYSEFRSFMQQSCGQQRLKVTNGHGAPSPKTPQTPWNATSSE
eukprot:TRINITY_DN73441_c0_g1_i1.p1 TRINITY_DN73441_c0_g1~~TRINITY_DN73441_c0_g1_i1.p1  ORF type:complete len:263 (-),score=51.89 TRINITY_DN73441_c0_g1_i1:86-805(-)